MFSLIITIISIALVAALALATLYYGGAAFNEGHTQVQAAKVYNQGQQLLGAAQLYKINHGHYALSLADMVPEYLKTLPIASASALSEALAADAWVMPVAGEPVFTLAVDATPLCSSINESGYGQSGVLAAVVADQQVQCYGTTTSDLTALAAMSSAEVTSVAAGSPTKPAVPLMASAPKSPLASEWLVSPRTVTASAPVPPEPSPAGVLSVSLAPIHLADPYPYTSTGTGLTFSNTGDAPLTFTSMPAVATSKFYANNSGCSTTLAAGASCSIYVGFVPGGNGDMSDTLTFDTDVSEPTAIALSGSAPAHIAVGQWTGANAADAPVTTLGDPGNSYSQTMVYLLNTSLDGKLSAKFTLVGDTDHFAIQIAPTGARSDAAGNNSLSWGVCTLAPGSLSTTAECTASAAQGFNANQPMHLAVSIKYFSSTPGTHSVQLVSTTTGNSVLPGPLTFTGTRN